MMVEKEIVIGRSRDDTFRLFTEGLGEWWPIPTHSIHGDDVVAAILEPRAGGRLYERTTDGTECEWGTIVEWNAPDGFSVSWKPNLDDDAHRTTWTVRFEAIDDTTTRLELVHTGWEGFGDTAESARGMYTTGWDLVLARFIEVA